MIIGLSATIGNGKDTLYKILKRIDDDIENKKFAYKLKLIASLITGCNVEDLELEDFKNSKIPISSLYKLEKIDEHLLSFPPLNVEKKVEYTYRELLQIIGDGFRNLICKDIWVNSLFNDYTDEKKWVITDLRYENEFDAIKERGGICIRIERKRTFSEWAKYFHLYLNDCDSNDKIFKRQFLSRLKEINFTGKEKFFKIHEHQSETGLNNYYHSGKFDYELINDSSIEELFIKTKKLNLFNGN